MKTVLLTMSTLKDNGITSLSRVDKKYCEVIAKGKTHLRNYYLSNNGSAHFYLNDVRYRIENFIEVVPEATQKIVVVPESDNKRIKEIQFEAKPEVSKEVKHHKYDTIKTCIEQDIPVYLVGEAGTGKNFTLQEIAKDLQLTFYFTNSVQQEYKITGFIDAGGVYHETEFYKAFTQGGLFFLDEIDASIPEVLVLLNAAIANRYFEFPNGRVDAHPDFRVVAAGNTVGSGANELYTGRLTLDSATLDRFVVIEFDYDKNIELMLAKGNTQLVNFIRSLREFCKKNGIRATFSYRMIISVNKLEAAGLNLKTILEIAVLKGLDRDTIKTLQVNNSGKYYFALKELQTAC
jgi:cobaltochelatase CobS